MKKTKRLLSLFLAVVMVLSAIPLSGIIALADSSTTLYSSAAAVHKNTSDTRYGTTTLTLTSDTRSGTFSYGVWKYDISGLPTNENVDSAIFSSSISYSSTASDLSSMSVKFFMVPAEVISVDQEDEITNSYSYVPTDSSNNGQYTQADLIGTTTSTNNPYNTVKSGLGLQDAYLLGEVAHGKTSFSFDIKSFIQSAIDSGWSDFYIVGIQATPNTSTSYWSDSIVTNPTLAVTTSLVVEDASAPVVSINPVTYVGGSNTVSKGNTILSSWPSGTTSSGLTTGSKWYDLSGESCPVPQITFNGDGKYQITNIEALRDDNVVTTEVTVGDYSKTSTDTQTISFSGTYDVDYEGTTQVTKDASHLYGRQLGFRISYKDKETGATNQTYLWTYCRYTKHYASSVSKIYWQSGTYKGYNYSAYYLQGSEGYGGTGYFPFPDGSTKNPDPFSAFVTDTFNTAAIQFNDSDQSAAVNADYYFDTSVDGTPSITIDGIRYNGQSSPWLDVGVISLESGAVTGAISTDASVIVDNPTATYSGTSTWTYHKGFNTGYLGSFSNIGGTIPCWYGTNYGTQVTSSNTSDNPGGYASPRLAANSLKGYNTITSNSTSTRSENFTLRLWTSTNRSEKSNQRSQSTANYQINVYVTNKATLRSRINEIIAKFPQKSGYTTTSYDSFLEAYQAACKVLDSNITQSQDEVTEALSALNTAYNNLEVLEFSNTLEYLQYVMTAYETKVKLGKVYTNMADAYQAYVDCQKAYDQYKYGGVKDTDLAGAIEKLDLATRNMREVTSYKKGTAVATFNGDDNPSYIVDGKDYGAAANSANILYTSEVSYSRYAVKAPTHTDTEFSKDNEASDTKIFYNPTVILYDGETTPSLPIMATAQTNSKSGSWYLYGAYPTDSTGSGEDSTQFALTGVWNSTSTNYNEAMQYGLSNGGSLNYSTVGYNKATGYFDNWGSFGDIYYRSGALNNNSSGWGNRTEFANVLQYTEQLPTDTVMATYYIAWYTGLAQSATSSNADLDTAVSYTDKTMEESETGYVYGSNQTPIYVINYKSIIETAENAAAKLNIFNNGDEGINVSNYKEGGLLKYMQAIDAIVNIDPNDYFKNINSDVDSVATAANNCKTAFEEAINAVTTAENSITEDYYQAMRDACELPGLLTTYELGNALGAYTESSWSDFADAYSAVKTVMANLVADGYTLKTAAPIFAKTLVNAYNALTTTHSKVDATELINLIVQIDGYDLTIFTDDTVAKLEAAIEVAKETVWTSVEYYAVAAKALDLSTENTAIVTEQIKLINEAFANLRISMDTKIETSSGVYYSLNTAVGTQDGLQLSDYSGTDDYLAAIEKAKTYAEKAKTESLTDYDKQYAAYEAMVKEVITAFENLRIAVTKLVDGQIVSSGTTLETMEQQQRSASGKDERWRVHWNYTTNAVVIRTEHTAKSVKYGTGEIIFATNMQNTNCPGNRLDGISLDDQSESATEVNMNKGYAWTHVNPSDLSTANAEAYKASLTASAYKGSETTASTNISISNIKVTQLKNKNSSMTYTVVKSDGSTLSYNDSIGYDVTDILGNTRGKSDVNDSIMAMSGAGNLSIYGEVYMQGDLNINLPATENISADKLTNSDGPSFDSYTTGSGANTKYFGGTYSFDFIDSSVYYAGWNHTHTAYESTVTVVDISNLITLINAADAITDSSAYTDQSWSNFQSKRAIAKETPEFSKMNAQVIAEYFKNNYDNLLTAYKQLELKSVRVAFSYKNASGADTAKNTNDLVGGMKYGESLSKYYTSSYQDLMDIIDGKNMPSYTENGYIYTFSGWDTDPKSELSTGITENKVYTAQYTTTEAPADFTKYNELEKTIMNLFTDKTFRTADITKYKTELDKLTYFNMSEEDRAKLTYPQNQSDIDAEYEKLYSLYRTINSEKASRPGYDISAAEATLDLLIAAKDADIYDSEGLTLDLYEEVEIGDKIRAEAYPDEASDYVKTVKVLKYTNQTQINNAAKKVIESIQIKQYDVYVNDEKIGTFPYGTYLQIYKDPDFGDFLYQEGEDEIETLSDEDVAWYYRFSSPTVSETNDKFMTTDSSYAFVVKGETHITAKEPDVDFNQYIVKFVNSVTDRIIDAQVTDESGKITLPEPINVAFYTFDHYEIEGVSYEIGDEVQLDDNAIVVAIYDVDADTMPKYEISLYSINDDEIFEPDYYSYNDKVSFMGLDMTENGYVSDDVYVWAELIDYDEFTFKILSYGGDYVFYACEDKIIVPLSYDDFESLDGCFVDDDLSVDKSGQYYGIRAMDTPFRVFDEDGVIQKFSIIGTFVLPENYTLVEKGILFSTDDDADLTIAEAMKNSQVRRMKSSVHTSGNQFVINLRVNGEDFDGLYGSYCSYLICKDESGNIITVYSQVYSVSVDPTELL